MTHESIGYHRRSAEVERRRIAFFGRVSYGVSDDPATVFPLFATRGFADFIEPSAAEFEGEFGVILGDIPHVIGDRTPNVQLGIILESIQQRHSQIWVLLKLA